MKISNCHFNKKEILQKAAEKSQKINTKTCQKKKKTRLMSIKKRYQELIQYEKEALRNK